MNRPFLLLFLLIGFVPAVAQKLQLNIIDGRTGKPVKHLYARVYIPTDAIHSKEILAVEQNNGYEFETEGAKSIQIGAMSFEQGHFTDYDICSDDGCKNGALPFILRVDQAFDVGIDSAKARDKAKIALKPGVVTLYVRKIPWWERVVDALYS